jgi:hypothetical protein
MTWAEKLIEHVQKRPPDFVITDELNPDTPYMLRWYLIPRNRLFNIYVHHFLRSDNDEALHDHPWMNASRLLSNEYTEHTIAAGGVHHRKIFRAGNWKVRLSGKMAHRVELHNGPCWSMFLTGPVYRTWGFHCPNGWVPFRKFTERTKESSISKGCGDAA